MFYVISIMYGNFVRQAGDIQNFTPRDHWTSLAPAQQHTPPPVSQSHKTATGWTTSLSQPPWVSVRFFISITISVLVGYDWNRGIVGPNVVLFWCWSTNTSMVVCSLIMVSDQRRRKNDVHSGAHFLFTSLGGLKQYHLLVFNLSLLFYNICCICGVTISPCCGKVLKFFSNHHN